LHVLEEIGVFQHPHSGPREAPSGRKSAVLSPGKISSASRVEILNEIAGVGGTVHRIEFAPNGFVIKRLCTFTPFSISKIEEKGRPGRTDGNQSHTRRDFFSTHFDINKPSPEGLPAKLAVRSEP
jgi:hypothetical protein